MGWVGKIVDQSPGRITLENPRVLHAGLTRGASDLIGWTKRDGSAIFTALEIKSAKGRFEEGQEEFINTVRGAGGIAGVVRSLTDAYKLLGIKE